MTEKFIFWAQALDNSSPDSITVRGEALGADDSLRRQKAVSDVSHVVKLGNRIFDTRGVQLTVDAQHFIIEVPSVQRDKAGRAAPIVCYGQYDREIIANLSDYVADSLCEFARENGRSIKPEHIELVHQAFSELKKKLKKRRIVFGTVIGAAVLTIVALICGIMSFMSSRTP